MSAIPLLCIDAKQGTVNRYARKPGDGKGFFRERTVIEPGFVGLLGSDEMRRDLEHFRKAPDTVPETTIDQGKKA